MSTRGRSPRGDISTEGQQAYLNVPRASVLHLFCRTNKYKIPMNNIFTFVLYPKAKIPYIDYRITTIVHIASGQFGFSLSTIFPSFSYCNSSIDV